MGARDSNGIYQYTEDDLESLFSDLLNLGQASTTAAIGLLRTRVGNLESAANRPYLTMRRGSAQIAPADGSATVLKSEAFGAFAMPIAYPPVGRVGDVYTNQYFSWNRATGELRVLRNGYYDLRAVLQFGVNSQGNVQLQIRKNGTPIAHDDDVSRSNAWTWLRPATDAQYLSTADVVTVTAAAISQGGNLAMGNYASPAAAELSITLRRLA